MSDAAAAAPSWVTLPPKHHWFFGAGKDDEFRSKLGISSLVFHCVSSTVQQSKDCFGRSSLSCSNVIPYDDMLSVVVRPPFKEPVVFWGQGYPGEDSRQLLRRLNLIVEYQGDYEVNNVVKRVFKDTL